MSSLSSLSYAQRAEKHRNPLAKKLFEIAEKKKSNIVVAADVSTTANLLKVADNMGPYIVVLKTHIDLVSDFSAETLGGLKYLSMKHHFLIFEDRQFMDTGRITRKQYHGGIFRISQWAHFVSAVTGDRVVTASQDGGMDGGDPRDMILPYAPQEPRSGPRNMTLPSASQGPLPATTHEDTITKERGLLLITNMANTYRTSSHGYASDAIDQARCFPTAVIGFVADGVLTTVESSPLAALDEDFVVFAPRIHLSIPGDEYGLMYQTPRAAIEKGADFLIAGRGIDDAKDPVQAVQEYQARGWKAYLDRIGRQKGESCCPQ